MNTLLFSGPGKIKISVNLAVWVLSSKLVSPVIRDASVKFLFIVLSSR